MVKRLLIDAAHKEEIRVAVVDGQSLEEFDSETTTKKLTKGNIYLAKVIRVEPSLQAAFVEYSGNKHGFLPFSEIHPDYYKIPFSDREEQVNNLFDDSSLDASLLGEIDTDLDSDLPEELENQVMSMSVNHELPVLSIEDSDSVDSGIISDQDVTSQLDEMQENLSVVGEGLPDVDSEITEEFVETEDDAETVSEIESVSPKKYNRRSKYRIQEVIKRRQILLVQVVKEERGNKGAALTTYLSLPGRYCVLMPNAGFRLGGISRKISDGEDRRRLRDLMKEFNVPEGMALIVRTAGKERNKAEIKRDYEYLQRLWDEIKDKTLNSNAPDLIYLEGDLIKRALRDIYNKDISEILISGDDAYKSAKNLMKNMIPSHAKKVRFYKDSLLPLLQKFNVEDQIEKMHESEQRLPSGGSIVINFTEALVAIDVNSGKSTRERHIDETAFKTNLEAAAEIARQMRLRDLGGLVVIDFIDMHDSTHIAAVEKKLREYVKNDRAKIQIGKISQFGLLELSRQRLRPSLFENHTVKCSYCDGKGFVRSIDSLSLQVLREMEKKLSDGKILEIKAIVPQGVDLYLLNQKRASIIELENRYGCIIYISRHENPHENGFLIEFEKKKNIKESNNALKNESHRIERDKPKIQEKKAPVKEIQEVEDTDSLDEKPISNSKKRRRNKKKNSDRVHPLEAELSQSLPPLKVENADDTLEVSTAKNTEETSDKDTEQRRKNRRSRNWKQKGKRHSDQAGSIESNQSETNTSSDENVVKITTELPQKSEKIEMDSESLPQGTKQPRKKWLRRFLK